MRTILIILILLIISGVIMISQKKETAKNSLPDSVRVYSYEKKSFVTVAAVIKSDDEWKKVLTDEQFQVTRHEATECAFTGQFYKNHEKGVYKCICCDNDLFVSDTKFESGTGWPSFFQPIAPENR